MIKELYLYLSIVPIFFGIDMLWITLVANKFYRKELGQFLAPTPIWSAAILFYLFYLLGVVFFVILPAVKTGDWTKALLWGAFFGAVAYATYDLTNYSTITNWSLSATIVDLMWGTFVTSVISVIGFYIARWLGV
jgi:uncharacterized membrane protein